MPGPVLGDGQRLTDNREHMNGQQRTIRYRIRILAGLAVALIGFGLSGMRAHAAGTVAEAAAQETGAATAAQETSAEAAAQENKTAPVLDRFLIDHRVLLLPAGGKRRLSVKKWPPKVKSRTVGWTVSDEAVLQVSEDGTVTALTPGHARVEASLADGAFTDTCAVLVYPDGDLAAIAEEQPNWTYKALYRAIVSLQGKKSPWKRILCIGDSVTAGVQAGSGKLQWIPNYPLTMSEILGVKVYNRGVGGSSIWSGGSFTIKDSLDRFEPADAVFVLGGYNDWFYGEQCPIGDPDTPGTFTGDFNALCDRITEVYPRADIFVIIPSTPHAHVGVEPYADFSWLSAIELEIARAHGFHVIHLPSEDILNGLEEDTWRTFFSDNVHLNDYGYMALGTIIADRALVVLQEDRAAGR